MPVPAGCQIVYTGNGIAPQGAGNAAADPSAGLMELPLQQPSPQAGSAASPDAAAGYMVPGTGYAAGQNQASGFTIGFVQPQAGMYMIPAGMMPVYDPNQGYEMGNGVTPVMQPDGEVATWTCEELTGRR
eukprot:gnl/MRDRNA2_/MRDRNA2_168291_c0_seq1.p2 gnl/MRDRNA2_/MRDRNA2_168291_c0~~gnl/MRDRNA2_/MRDRNA2_168291_c0_seq1.p2  ORF type:complete len:138 (+),score=22.75 gnl/MRDRNA2_/MRDRNA2_168291_c0_seq1:26-415(+)